MEKNKNKISNYFFRHKMRLCLFLLPHYFVIKSQIKIFRVDERQKLTNIFTMLKWNVQCRSYVNKKYYSLMLIL
jgi:hypothetical protein